MSADRLETLLRRFRRQLAKVRAIRVGVVLLLIAVFSWTWWLPEPIDRSTVFVVLAGVLLAWVALAVSSVRLTQAMQTGRILLRTGQLDDAEVWLRRAMTGLSLSVNTQLVAGQQLALLFFRRGSHLQVVAICRELLRQNLKRLRHAWVSARLMLADSLLILDRIDEAYEAMRPVYDVELSLADRMKLLPIQLRYELASDHSASASAALAEKVQIAELLDSPQAGLVHALLAEACRRQAMPAQHAFLAERARLYWDLDQLAERYAVIAPICGGAGPGGGDASDE